MNKLFRPKCMRRMAVFMALVAPIVYLFGSLFFALNGAHGTEVFAEGDTYSQTFELGLSRGYIDTDSGQVADNASDRFLISPYMEVPSINGILVSGYGSFTDVRCFWYDSEGVFLTSTYLPYNADSVSYSAPTGSASFRLRYYLTYPPVYFYSCDITYYLDSYDLVGSSAFSDYVFGQFFAKDNFLVKWGENAISENPYGFAPFGYFWRYLDTNFLHMSNEQVGLMGYGYMYYAAHVLLFDIGFILVTFFINVIQKVTDKIGGGDL